MEYYKNDLVTLYHGDCAGQLLPLLGECDVLITDPPYGIDSPTNFTTARKRLPKTRGRRCVGIELVGEYCELAKSLLIDPKEFL